MERLLISIIGSPTEIFSDSGEVRCKMDCSVVKWLNNRYLYPFSPEGLKVADRRRFLNIAHRGFSSRYPENTLLAFEQALEVGVGWLELDVHQTSDSVPVVIHDATVDRTTDGTGPVAKQSFDDIRRLDAGAWKGPDFAGLRIPSLSEALAAAKGRSRLVVELKGSGEGFVSRVVDEVERSGLYSDVAYSSFRVALLDEVRKQVPGAAMTPLGGMAGRTPGEVVEQTLALGADTVGMAAKEVTAELVATAHDAGLLLRCWGAADDRGPAMRRLLDMGVDGMTTNHPDILMNLLREAGVDPF